MTTIFYPLVQTQDKHELLRSTYLGMYLHGECYAFAIAVHTGTGWPIVGLMLNDTVWHAGVRMPDGRILDARGALSEDEFARHYTQEPYTLSSVSVEELYAIRPIDDFVIARARRHAEALWPKLEWKETQAEKVRAFANELETLCRTHGFWITGSVPAQPPRLYNASGEEGGYRVQQTIDGNAFTINRYFPFELVLEEAERALR